MKKFNKDIVTKPKRRYKGIVYILRLRLRSGEVVYKIGMTTRKLAYRISELTNDYFHKYGYIPMVEVVKSSKSRWYIEVEQELLDKTKHWYYKSSKKVDGVTEYRCGVDMQILSGWYDECISRTVWEPSKDNKVVYKIESKGINDIDPISY